MPKALTMAMAVKILLVCLMVVTNMAKIIDLSHVHDKDSFMAPGNPHYQRNITFSGDAVPGLFVEHGELFSGEHGGTHMDAPYHFARNGKHLHELPLEYTILDGVMIDCSSDVKGNHNYVMPLQTLHDWEKKHGRIPQGAAVIVNFGWSSRFGDSLQYVNTNDPSHLKNCFYPTLSKEAGEWLATERDAKLLGVDTMAADLYKDEYPIHLAFLKNDRVLLENLKDTHRLPPKGFRLHAAPVKYKDASGAQVRVYAIPYDSMNGSRNLCTSGVEHLIIFLLLALILLR